MLVYWSKLLGPFLTSIIFPELNVQCDRSNMGLGRVEDACTKCLLYDRCVKSISQMGNVFLAFMDLEKGYDTIDLHGMWQMLRVYGVGGKLFQNFYVDRRARVR